MLMDKINAQIKEAMIKKDEITKNTLRAVKSDVTSEARERHCEVTDELTLEILRKTATKIGKDLEEFEKVGATGTELYEKTKQELTLLEEYLPKLMSEDEIRAKAIEIISNLPADAKFGIKMSSVMKELKGKADGKLVQSVVKSL